MDDLMTRFEEALDANDLRTTQVCCKEMADPDLYGAHTPEEWADFRKRHENKIEAIARACADVYNAGEVGNNELFFERILARWEAIDNDWRTNG